MKPLEKIIELFKNIHICYSNIFRFLKNCGTQCNSLNDIFRAWEYLLWQIENNQQKLKVQQFITKKISNTYKNIMIC